MLLISPYVARHYFSVCSLTSGGNLIFLMLIPTSSMYTCDISPLSCMYSSCPCESCRTSFTWSLFVNFMYTRLLGPSTWIICTSASTSRNFSWIHSWISNADIRGLRVRLYRQWYLACHTGWQSTLPNALLYSLSEVLTAVTFTRYALLHFHNTSTPNHCSTQTDGNRTRDLMISRQRLWPLDHEAGHWIQCILWHCVV